MPSKMMKRRCVILQWLAKTDNISQIARETGYDPKTIRKIKNQLTQNEDIFDLPNKLGTPKKVTTDIQNEIQNLTMASKNGQYKSDCS